MRKRSKQYLEQLKAQPKEAVTLVEAVKKVKGFKAKFDQTVDCCVWLGIDPKSADQLVRGAISLPNGIGKSKRVIVFCDESDAEVARAAGAIEAGAEELIKKVEGGWSDFDVAIAHPKVMGKAGKLGRVLGPQGKMPSPKNGTVTADIKTAVQEFAAGKVEFRNDAGGNLHVVVGKQSFDDEKLVQNIEAFLNHIRRIKPSTAKGTYIKRISVSATMSPGVDIIVS